MIAQCLNDARLRTSTERVLHAIEQDKHSVRVTDRGQIVTSISSCPRELKPSLLLDGIPTVICDIAYAHHCFLPRLLLDRIAYVRRTHGDAAYLAALEAERARLTAVLSQGDYYRKFCRDGGDDAERQQKKNLLNMLLNWPNEKCLRNALYCRLKQLFPRLVDVMEDVKRKDHRNLSKQLQRFTADVVSGALEEIQAAGIPVIPDVDALICQEHHRHIVCTVLGRHMYGVSGGVCCKVNGVRYSPDADIDLRLLTWDEESSEDGGQLGYDEWEAKRDRKTIAVLAVLGRVPDER